MLILIADFLLLRNAVYGYVEGCGVLGHRAVCRYQIVNQSERAVGHGEARIISSTWRMHDVCTAYNAIMYEVTPGTRLDGGGDCEMYCTPSYSTVLPNSPAMRNNLHRN